VQTGTSTSTTSVIPIDNTIPQNTEGAELFTVSITPKSATSKLLIQMVVQAAPSSGAWMSIALFQDSGVNAIAATTLYTTVATAGVCIPLTYYMHAGTTSSPTFKLRYGPSGNTMVINGSSTQLFGGTLISSMTITEISA